MTVRRTFALRTNETFDPLASNVLASSKMLDGGEPAAGRPSRQLPLVQPDQRSRL